MYIDLLSQPNVAAVINISIMFMFVIAFLLSYKNWRNSPSVFIAASVLFVNFVLANNALYEFLATPEKPDYDFYLRWVQYDSLSIIAILFIHLILKVKRHKCTVISMWLLIVNITVCLSMHIDIMVNGNREPWLLWTIYTPVIHFNELIIAACFVVYSALSISKEQPAREQ
jgi:hypothetical protein